eukprot:TRINITY_DN14937_c0_g1_i3.p1 TRINITY_DN14937_c0_g1~~TRINITY_DN14937_c0_g1_i3.p1  ORF type:complete len:996 (+),score=175.29 TRINITY_DN14937_c0_g1_i3:247-3234(+)
MDFSSPEYNQIYDSNDACDTSSVDSRSGAQSGRERDPRRHGYTSDQNRGAIARHSSQKCRKGLLGLSNLGNTCFMNAALQCLTHTHGLQKYFRFCTHAYASKGQSNRQKLLMAFAHWFERDWAKGVSAHYHVPEDILRSVQQLSPAFSGCAQQDSQEFLRCVLDHMHEELRREVPDDLDSYLQAKFGIEAHGSEASVATSSDAATGCSSTRQIVSGGGGAVASGDMADAAGDNGTDRPAAAAAPSATRQLMQLCQTTEGVTDVGEIRLPEAKPPSQVSSRLGGSEEMPASTEIAAGNGGPSEAGDRGATHPQGVGGDGDGDAATAGARPAASSTTATTTEKDGAKEEIALSTHFSSIVSELFQGRMVSVVRCLDCQKTSRCTEVVYDVSVPIPNASEPQNGPFSGTGDFSPLGATSSPSWTGGFFSSLPGKVKGFFYDKGVEVTDCLRKHCAPELLTGKDRYFCEHCKRKNDSEKRIAFKELPEVLCVHLKRFRHESSWTYGTKNSKVVTFPVNKPLDMAPFLDTPSPHPVEYKLIGLIQHIGSMGSGHYISYCQHKKKPQDWYEFDDTHSNMVLQEQVERAEPYVLFYQRLPSKATKLDRQNFKNEQRRVDSQIRAYLAKQHPPLSRTPAEGDDGGGGDGDTGKVVAAQSESAAMEEWRQHGPALRNLYRNPPSELDVVFVSKHWYVRLTTMSQPGPLDNFEYLCPHRLLGSHSAEMAAEPFIPISRALFQSLVQKYGGGPVISSLEICTKCQMHIRAYNDRKQAEYDLVTKYDTKDKGSGKCWYLVDALWVNKWKRYVRAEHVTDIRDMCAPGRITNLRLFDKDNPEKIRQGVKLRVDYIGVNVCVWLLFMHVHGGGPCICTEELDIYSAECTPETDLCLDELAGNDAETAEFSRRISRELVDECHGDMALWEERFGKRSATALKASATTELGVSAAHGALTTTSATPLGGGEATTDVMEARGTSSGDVDPLPSDTGEAAARTDGEATRHAGT